MSTLRRFLKERSLILSVEKTKMMVFNKGRNGKKEIWKWEGNNIEEVDNFKYLGFTFNSNCNYKEHIRDLKRKGIYAAKQAWSLGEKRCRNDFRSRKMLYEYLVRSVIEYGVEIWGLEGVKEVEKIKTDYYRWTLGLDFCTPRYIVYRETGNMKMKVEWGIRVMKYEEKIIEQSKERLTRLCWEEQRLENNRQNVINLKESFLNKMGLSSQELDIIRDLGKDAKEEVRKRAKDIENQVICTKIREARYNQNYKDYIDICEVDRIPKYLWKVYGNVDIKSIARIRCGNVERANKY